MRNRMQIFKIYECMCLRLCFKRGGFIATSNNNLYYDFTSTLSNIIAKTAAFPFKLIKFHGMFQQTMTEQMYL
jgi:hypothetical protein